MKMQRLQDSPVGWIKAAGAKNKSWLTRYTDRARTCYSSLKCAEAYMTPCPSASRTR